MIIIRGKSRTIKVNIYYLAFYAPYFVGKAFVFASSDLRQSASMLASFGRHSVQEDGHGKFAGQAPCELLGARNALVHTDALHGDEGTHVQCAHTRMLA